MKNIFTIYFYIVRASCIFAYKLVSLFKRNSFQKILFMMKSLHIYYIYILLVLQLYIIYIYIEREREREKNETSFSVTCWAPHRAGRTENGVM